MKTYEISENLLVAVLNYLGKQPYNEVDALIKGIQQVKPITKEEIKEHLKTIKNGQTN